MKTLKKIRKENENEFRGNLPIYRNDLNTSIAFQVLTNQIVVVEIKNHRLYKIHIEQLIVIEDRVRKLKFKLI